MPLLYPTDQISPPVSIGGPTALPLTVHPETGENVLAAVSSASACIPSEQAT